MMLNDAPAAISASAKVRIPYDLYTESSYFWLHTLPSHWQVQRLRFLTTCLDGMRIPLNSEERARVQGEFPYWGANRIVDHVDQWIFDEELVLLGEDGAPFLDRTREVAFRVSGKMWVNNHIHVLRPNKRVSASFLAHALNSVDYHAYIDGSTRDKLVQSDMADIPIPVPPLDEQEAICRFLDRECDRIDRLISAKERVNSLLQQKTVALISSLVTRGLDPSAPTKRTSIDWLDTIPEHWELPRNRVVFREVDDRASTGDEELLTVSHISGVTPRAEKNVFMFLAESTEGYRRCRKGDLAINTMWAWMGALGVSQYDGIVSPSYHVYRPNTGYVGDYLDLLYRTPQYVCEINRRSKGVWSSRLRLYPNEFLDMRTLTPPIAEQEAIVERVRSEIEPAQRMADTLGRSIELLREYRAALVTAAVTGKFAIRSEAD